VLHIVALKRTIILKNTRESNTPDKLYVATTTHDSLNDVLRMKLDGQFFDINMVFGFQMIKMHGMKKSPNKATGKEFRSYLLGPLV
jgi:hypothetical protein